MSGPRVMPPMAYDNDPTVRPPSLLGTRSGWQRPPPRASNSPGLPVTRSRKSSRDLQEWQRQATPPLDAPVVARARVCFHTPLPRRGRLALPSMGPRGRADRPLLEASGNVMSLATAERRSGTFGERMVETARSPASTIAARYRLPPRRCVPQSSWHRAAKRMP